MKKLGSLFLALIVFCYVGACLRMYLIQDRILFPKVAGDFHHCEKLLPKDLAIDAQIAGERVRFYLRADDHAKAWLILFHGNDSSACSNLAFADQAKNLHLNVVVAEYPGYLEDAREVASQQSLTHNSEALYDFIQTKNNEKLPVFVFGRSLGTGVATYLASVREVKGVVLMSPYTSMSDVADYRYPYLPAHWLLRNTFPAFEWAKKVKGAVFIGHGDRDNVISIEIGARQSMQFPNLYKFLVLPGVDHYNIVDPSSGFWQAAREFVSKTE